MAAAITAFGIGSQIFGSILGSSASKKAARRARQIGRLNEKDFLRQAVDAVERGERLVGLSRLQNARLFGMQLAAQSAAGLNADFGSAAQVREETAYFSELDAATIRDNTRREMEGFLHAAKIARLGGNASARASEAQGIEGLLTGFSNAAASASQMFR